MSLDVNPVALRINRKNMDIFIRADPIQVSLVRSSKTQTAAGGWVKSSPVTLDPQQFRLVPFKRRLYDFTMMPTPGTVQVEQYVLVGRHTVDIVRDDEFNFGGDHYTVQQVEPKTNDRAKTDRVVALVWIELEDKNGPA